MKTVSNKKYIKLFYVLLQLKNQEGFTFKLDEITDEDKSYIVALAHLLDKRDNLFGFTYDIKKGILASDNISFALNFLKADFEGTILELQNVKESIPKEKFTLNVLGELLNAKEISLSDKEAIINYSLITYFKGKGFKNYGDAKKYILKEKIEDIDLENLKSIWKNAPEI